MKKPTHFAVDDIIFYGMDEDNNIICDKNGKAIQYRLKDDIRFKPLEYITENLDPEIMLEQPLILTKEMEVK